MKYNNMKTNIIRMDITPTCRAITFRTRAGDEKTWVVPRDHTPERIRVIRAERKKEWARGFFASTLQMRKALRLNWLALGRDHKSKEWLRVLRTPLIKVSPRLP